MKTALLALSLLAACAGQLPEEARPVVPVPEMPSQTPAKLCADSPSLPECQRGTGRPVSSLLEGEPDDVGAICRFQGSNMLKCGAGELCGARNDPTEVYDTCCVPAGTLFPSSWPHGFPDSIDGVPICCPGAKVGGSKVPGFYRCD